MFKSQITKYKSQTHKFWSLVIWLLVIVWNLLFGYGSLTLYAQESNQQISEFSLQGFGKRGEKSWDISGETADIFDDTIKLKDVVGNFYQGQEDVRLTAEKGDFNKTDGSVRLEDNVVITTSKGAKLTTDSLDWDRKKQIVMTQDLVNVERQNLIATALGASGELDLHKVALQKDVQVQIHPLEREKKSEKNAQNKTVITCDGTSEIDYEKNVATFKDNVKVDRQDLQIFSDAMDVYFLTSGEDKTAAGPDTNMIGNRIDRIICKGNVKIVRQDNVSFSEEAVYSATDKRIILRGKPRLIITSTEDLDASFANQRTN